MGVTTPETVGRGVARETGERRAGRWMVPLAWASLVANIGIVVTGGAVRLTGSGLGCPTWPRCTDRSFRPHGALELHSAIEFGNRMLTFVLVAVAVATFVAAWRTRRPVLRRLALVLALGIPAQALIGGITVLTDLNPWVVSLHLLLSLALVDVAVLLLWQVHDAPEPHPGADAAERARGGRALVGLAWATFAVAAVVLAVGTVVTGSGPHAGDAEVPRNGLSPLQLSQLHADVVFLLVGLTVGLLLALHALGAPAVARRAALLLLLVELAQGVVGFVQYLTDLPVVLVGIHLLGAALVSAAATHALIAAHPRRGITDRRGLPARLAKKTRTNQQTSWSPTPTPVGQDAPADDRTTEPAPRRGSQRLVRPDEKARTD